jgi:hypothetical protein
MWTIPDVALKDKQFQWMIAVALAHVVGNRVEAAYRRGSALEKRRQLMNAWARCTTPASRAGKVVAIGAGR